MSRPSTLHLARNQSGHLCWTPFVVQTTVRSCTISPRPRKAHLYGYGMSGRGARTDHLLLDVLKPEVRQMMITNHVEANIAVGNAACATPNFAGACGSKHVRSSSEHEHPTSLAAALAGA